MINLNQNKIDKMNNVNKPKLMTGARVRVLATNELGTITDKQLIRKNGQTRTYCNVRLDKKPEQDTWYFVDQLGDTKECATVTMADERGRKLILRVTQYYDKAPDKNNMHVELEAEDGGNLQDHEGSLHFALTALLFKALVGESGE